MTKPNPPQQSLQTHRFTTSLMRCSSKSLHSLQSLFLLWHDSLCSSHWPSLFLFPFLTGNPISHCPSPTCNSKASHISLEPLLLGHSASSQFCILRCPGQWVWDAVHLLTLCRCERSTEHSSELFPIAQSFTKVCTYYL